MILVEQNEFQQREIIRLATKDGSLAELYWFIQMVLPPLTKKQRRTSPPAAVREYDRKRISTACAPANYIPVIPVAPDPERSRLDAEYLAFFFSLYNPDTIIFKPALSLQSEIEKALCYLYPDATPAPQVDHICPHCGAISPNGICSVCAPPPLPVLIYDGTRTHWGSGHPPTPRCGAATLPQDTTTPTPAKLQILAPILCPACFIH